MKYKYDIFELSNQNDFVTFVNNITKGFKLIDRFNYNSKNKYILCIKKISWGKLSSIPLFVIFATSNDIDFIDLLDGYYLNKQKSQKYKSFINGFGSALIEIIEVDIIDDSFVNIIESGLYSSIGLNDNVSKVLVIYEKETRKLYISNLPVFYIKKMSDRFYNKLHQYVIKAIENISNIETIKNSKKSLINNNYEKNKNLIYSKFNFIKYSSCNILLFVYYIIVCFILIILLNCNNISSIENSIIIGCIIVLTCQLLILFINGIKNKMSKYDRIKIEKKINIKDFKNILNKENIEYEMKNNNINVRIKNKFLHVTNNQDYVAEKDMVIILDNEIIRIKNYNKKIFSYLIKKLKKYNYFD